MGSTNIDDIYYKNIMTLAHNFTTCICLNIYDKLSYTTDNQLKLNFMIFYNFIIKYLKIKNTQENVEKSKKTLLEICDKNISNPEKYIDKLLSNSDNFDKNEYETMFLLFKEFFIKNLIVHFFQNLTKDNYKQDFYKYLKYLFFYVKNIYEITDIFSFKKQFKTDDSEDIYFKFNEYKEIGASFEDKKYDIKEDDTDKDEIIKKNKDNINLLFYNFFMYICIYYYNFIFLMLNKEHFKLFIEFINQQLDIKDDKKKLYENKSNEKIKTETLDKIIGKNYDKIDVTEKKETILHFKHFFISSLIKLNFKNYMNEYKKITDDIYTSFYMNCFDNLQGKIFVKKIDDFIFFKSDVATREDTTSITSTGEEATRDATDQTAREAEATAAREAEATAAREAEATATRDAAADQATRDAAAKAEQAAREAAVEQAARDSARDAAKAAADQTAREAEATAAKAAADQAAREAEATAAKAAADQAARDAAKAAADQAARDASRAAVEQAARDAAAQQAAKAAAREAEDAAAQQAATIAAQQAARAAAEQAARAERLRREQEYRTLNHDIYNILRKKIDKFELCNEHKRYDMLDTMKRISDYYEKNKLNLFKDIIDYEKPKQEINLIFGLKLLKLIFNKFINIIEQIKYNSNEPKNFMHFIGDLLIYIIKSLNCINTSENIYVRDNIIILYEILEGYKNIEDAINYYDYEYLNYQIKLRINVLYSIILINYRTYKNINLKNIINNSNKNIIYYYGNEFNFDGNKKLIIFFKELFQQL